MFANRYIAAVPVLLLLLAGCSDDGSGSVTDSDGASGPVDEADEEEPRPFDPDDWDVNNYFEASIGDFTVDPLDPSAVDACELIAPEVQEQFVGPVLETRPEDSAGASGCMWSGEAGAMRAFVREWVDPNAVVVVLQFSTFEDSEGFRREVIDVGGYPGATTEPPNVETCSLQIATSDRYAIEIDALLAPENGCDYTVDFALAILDNLPPADG